MTTIANVQWALRLRAEFDHSIPLSRAIGIRVINYDGKHLELSAPLAPNVNDKGTAFGGSISCLLTLAGWGVIWIACARAKVPCDIVIHKGTITYNKPVHVELHASCPVPARVQMQEFISVLKKKGRARLSLKSELLVDGDIMTVFDCQYAALLARK